MSPLEAANNVIRNAIEAANGPLPPSFVVEFLLTHWRQYLAAIHRVHGEASQEWKDAIAVSDQLVDRVMDVRERGLQAAHDHAERLWSALAVRRDVFGRDDA